MIPKFPYFSYDGAEFRLVKEIAKNWKLKIIDRHGDPNITDVYKQVKILY